MRKINDLIIHCTATREGKEYSVEDIDRWHRERGFDCIGYHYVIYLDGSVHAGRPEEKIGAHCVGHNSRSIGIAYVGGLDKDGKPKDTRTEEQKISLVNLLRELKSHYPTASVHGHCDYAGKACPCFDAKNEYRYL